MLTDLYLNFSFLMKDDESPDCEILQVHVPIWGSFGKWCESIFHKI